MTSEHDPVAFAEKLRHWRENGGLSLTFGGRDGTLSKEEFHNKPSRFQRERNIIADLKASGKPFDRAPTR